MQAFWYTSCILIVFSTVAFKLIFMFLTVQYIAAFWETQLCYYSLLQGSFLVSYWVIIFTT
jgi:hypothetical protein